MQLEALFKAAVNELKRHDILFAVAGGLAADLYRNEPRLTMDVDITILTESNALQAAKRVLKDLGLEAGVAREADLAGGPLFAIRQGSTKACMVVGRPKGESRGAGVDLILPAMPWVPDAVRRAQMNTVDFGFGPVPALTLEDLLLSKLWALGAARVRPKDLDDLQSIFDAGHNIDIPFLSAQMRSFDMTIPRAAEPFLPDIILKIARDIVRSHRRGSK